MFDRLFRIVRSEVGSLRQKAANAWHRAGGPERYEHARRRVEDAVDRLQDPGVPEETRKAFAALEIPLTATEEEIRKAYRRLMSRYHPDRHARDHDKEAIATELSRRLTEAYNRALAWRAAKR